MYLVALNLLFINPFLECKMQFQMVLGMPDDEPRKMEEIRRFSAIYGRFDCKRKPEKPLTLHEVS